MRLPLVAILICLLTTGCRPTDSTPELPHGKRVAVQFARGFIIEQIGDSYLVTVRDPLDTMHILATYRLKHDNKKGKDQINIPVSRLVSFSTTHIGFLDVLGVQNTLVGFSGTTYICNDSVRKMVDEGKIVEVGNEGGIDHEKIVMLHPDIVMTYLTGNAAYDQVDKLYTLGLQPVINNEFMELSPLGQAEWIKFIAVFYDRLDEANAIFDKVMTEYIATSSLVGERGDRPTVFTGMAYKGEWTIPGGKSFAAGYIHDAGGKYLWESDSKTGNFPVSFETMLSIAGEAEIWLHPGASASSAEILAADERYASFDALKTGHIFNNNARLCEGGGNDYWERGIVFPNEVLADLVAIFHPEVLKDHTFTFYTHLR